MRAASSQSSAASSDLQASFAALIPQIRDVYSRFCSLSELAKRRFGGELAGKLLLYGPMNAEGAAIALAGSIAGAATLGVDDDPERLKQGIRHGFCDFLVNKLDEALRILKNEVRKGQPVSVSLQAELSATLREMVERGLQPDILGISDHGNETAPFLERGAVVLEAPEAGESWLDWTTWAAETAPALWLPKVDALAAEALPAGDDRLRWLKFAPRYLGRSMAGQRGVRMTAEEGERFSALVQQAVESGAIGTRITILR